MHWRCSNEDASKTRHAHSATTALVAGGSVAFHLAANVWDSLVLGTLAVFDRARREVLDGTERLSSPVPDLEIGSRSPDLVPAFLQLWLGQGNRARRFPHCPVDVGEDFGSSHYTRVPHHDYGGVGSLPVRIFPFSEFGNRALSAYRLHFTARRAHPVSSRFIIRLLAADSQRWQISRPGHAPYYFAVPLFSAHQYRAPISDCAAAWSIRRLLQPPLTRERCIFG